MEKREVRRKSARTVPVIIENHENAAKKTKLMVPSNYTAGQLVNILRSRMRLRPSHPVFLFLKSKQSPVLMSKSIGHLHHKYRDEKGLLRLIHAGQTSFGFRGNIRAIRFRQKWLENLQNIVHQSTGGLQSNSDMPPPYFPLEPPTTTNFGVPLDVDSLSDSNEEMPGLEDLYHITDYNEIDDYAVSDSPSWPSSVTTGSSQSALTNSSQSSTLANSTHLYTVGNFEDAWISASLNPGQSFLTANSGVTVSMSNTSLLDSYAEDLSAYDYEIGLDNGILYGASDANGSSSSLSADGPIPAITFYESDSDWSVSDKDVDTED